MGPTPERPISDPLLRPENGQRDARGRPVRAPLGNSIRTFLIFVLLVVVGAVVWWVRRPDDLSASIGGREWTITDVDGTPATSNAGVASAFVLDGDGEVRAPTGCNVATGRWAYDQRQSELAIEWETQTNLVCPEGWPRTYLPDGGKVDIDGAVMTITTDTGSIRAVALAEIPAAGVDDVSGTWTSAGTAIEIGRRGLFAVGDCDGSWESVDEEQAMAIEFEDLEVGDCGLAATWRDDTPIVPALDGDVLYLRRDRTIFPLDREIIRLEVAS